jgi:hypothetical protein
MSTLATDTITDRPGTGGPTLPNGLTIGSAPMPPVTGTAPIYACRAWVNFNGTGTVAIRASGNVSSITDNGVGDYTVNFTTAMPDANYSVAGSGADNTGTTPTVVWINNNRGVPQTDLVNIGLRATNNSTSDSTFVNVAIFR